MTTSRRPSPAFVLASASLVLSLSGTAYAAGGGDLVLGAKNKAGKTTSLSVKGAATTLSLRSKGGPAASFTPGPGQAPFTVASGTVVGSLNADQVDGLDASAFRRTTDPVDAATLGGLRAEQFARADGAVLTAAVTGADRPVPEFTGMPLTADEELQDPAGMHAPGAAALVAPRTGTYLVSATVTWEPEDTGYRRASIVSSAGEVASVAGPPLPAPGYTSQNLSGIVHLLAGQEASVEVIQGSDASLEVSLDRFAMTRVGN